MNKEYFDSNNLTHHKKSYLQKILLPIFCFLLCVVIGSCRKLIEIGEPTSTIPTSKVFSSDDIATQALAGVYYRMVNNTEPLLNTGGMTIYCGLSADELVLYDQSNVNAIQFNRNSLTALNNQLSPRLWSAPFSNLYSANAVIEGLEHSSNITDSVKNELIGEAKFVRAFINFNLVNLYGDIPILVSTDWRKNSLLPRSSVSKVYEQIIADLKDAQSLLQADYRVGKGERIIPIKSAASALLARAYLYTSDWANAESLSTQVINSNIFSLEAVLNDVFKPNSNEAIWQLKQDNSAFTFNATSEGFTLVPIVFPFFALPPFAYITPQLLGSFEPNDNRKTSWLNSLSLSGTTYYYPYKYKIGRQQFSANGPYSEYYMVLRLAEQYLIRAEARAKLNKTVEAITDLNMIRQRAGITDLPTSLTQKETIDAIAQERKIELFCEWGHRWLDIKRTGKVDEIMPIVKGNNWQTTDKLYPIPYSEILTGANLTQNQGY